MSKLVPRKIKRRWRFLAVGLVALLAGCSSIPDAVNPVEWYKGARDFVSGSDDQSRTPESARNKPPAERGPVAPGADQPIPDLNTVPERPDTSSREQRAQLRRGLVSDREGARRYSREAVRRQGDPVNPLQTSSQTAARPAAPRIETPPESPSVPPVVSTPPPVPIPGGDASTVSGVRSLSEFNPAVVMGSYQVATILFGSGSARLSARDQRIIRQVFEQQRQTGGTIRIVGHASRQIENPDLGRQELGNLRVSAARADAVARELIELGARPGSLFVGAMADRYPRYHEYRPSGEAGNRRVEIFIDF